MPRPAPAQLLYGSATVICSALVMLLLSGARSGTGVTVIAVAALALGLLVSLSTPHTRSATTPPPEAPRAAPSADRVREPSLPT